VAGAARPRRRHPRALAAPAAGSPFQAPALALARLRGVEADPAFVLRATLGVFPLPEVCDPDAANEVCRQLNASVFLPFTVPAPGALAFLVEVRDRAGAACFAQKLEQDTAVADLRMARPVARIPGAELADGSYELRVRALVDGAPPRPADPELRVRFAVLRGYQARAERALGTARDLAPQLPQRDRSLLEGLAAEVRRAYLGEAFDVASDAVGDLVRLEAALENLRQDRHPLHGLRGELAGAVPGAAAPLACVLRPAGGRSLAEPGPARPLVVIAGASPAYDLEATRPAAPATRGPRWLAAELGGFAAGRDWDLAFLESPGGGRNYAEDLRRAIPALRELCGTRDRPVVLVCDRESASIAGLQLAGLRGSIAGLVLVGAGAIPAPVLDGLGDLPVRLGLLHGCRSSDGLQRVLDYVARAQAEQRWRGDVRAFGGPAPAWPYGLPAFAPAIEAFVAQLAGP